MCPPRWKCRHPSVPPPDENPRTATARSSPQAFSVRQNVAQKSRQAIRTALYFSTTPQLPAACWRNCVAVHCVALWNNDGDHALRITPSPSLRHPPLTLYGDIKTADQRTIIQQYGDWYTGRWWVGCYIWYIEEEPGRAAAPPVPSSLYQM